ncbi:hypothetical protein PGT21_006638 [Puccinia graminis f. sp. tritici]|uniref:CCHC-type domain-containing protein n=1 Tax=Puccinia graminis f. sp. tritici TaxID=56615 RepID=A0A5B0RBK0_PUCGR|nr:hypothetical protein PGT21_006638 [Puccinia graminis f. sp. tritici]KAA1123116.1 hypothetical protein PGTUg99_010244 [Puccinia graminis f. sp. tritici]
MRLNIPISLLAATLLSTSLAMPTLAEHEVVHTEFHPSPHQGHHEGGSGQQLDEYEACIHCGSERHDSDECPEEPKS